MQLAITVLGNLSPDYFKELLSAIHDSKCSIIEMHSSRFSKTRASYLLTQGNWNEIAKLERALDTLQRILDIKLQTLRTESDEDKTPAIPYVLETFSIDQNAVAQNLSLFLLEHGIEIEDINASQYQAAYTQSHVFNVRLILSIPAGMSLMNFREDLMDYCDQLNLDALLEPLKR